MSLQGHRIGVLVLLSAGLFGGGTAVAEPLLGLPNSVSALGAPWLVCAFAVGTLVPRQRVAAAAGALMLSGATAVYYAAQAYGYGSETIGYAITMTLAWGACAALVGGIMATAGSLWRGATGPRAALLAALPAAALAGEAALLFGTWRTPDATVALCVELATAVALVVVLSRQRSPVWSALAGAAVLAVAFAIVEAELRGYMRAAGWHGA